MPPKDFDFENAEVFTKGYDVGYQDGYLAAKATAEPIITKLQETISVLRDTVDELRTELKVRMYE